MVKKTASVITLLCLTATAPQAEVCRNEAGTFRIAGDGYTTDLSVDPGSGGNGHAGSRVIQETHVPFEDMTFIARTEFTWPALDTPSRMLMRLLKDGQPYRAKVDTAADHQGLETVVFFKLDGDVEAPVAARRLPKSKSIRALVAVNDNRAAVFERITDGSFVQIGMMAGNDDVGVVHREFHFVMVPRILGGTEQALAYNQAVHPTNRKGDCIDLTASGDTSKCPKLGSPEFGKYSLEKLRELCGD